MAMASSASLDSVVINVESDANNAGDGLAKLTKQLQTLRESVKGGFNNLTKLAKSLNDLKPASEGLATVASNLKELQSVTGNLKELSSIETPSGLTNTITRLKELSEVSKTLEKTAENVSNITKMVEPLTSLASIQKPLGLGNTVRYLTDLSKLGNLGTVIGEVSKLPQIVEPLQSLGNITSGNGMGKVVENLNKLPEVMAKLGDTKALENIGRVARELVSHLEPLSQEMQRIANGYSAISKMSDTYGVSARTVTRYTKQSVSVFKQLGSAVSTTVGWFKKIKTASNDFGNSAVKQFQKVNSKIKQIALSLIGTRTLFTMIRKAVSEYSAMDEQLQKFSQNVWRAFGAQLAPAIEYAMYLFKQFVRVIYSVVLALTGIDLIARANQKAMAGWGKSAKDTLGNLQKFDDLNVVEFPKNSGGGDDNSLIDLQTIDLTPFQKIIDWVKKMRDEIKAALDTGQWYNVGKVFAEGVNEGINFLLSKIPIILEDLMIIGTKFGEFLNGIIENVKWSDVGKFISEGLKAVPVFLSALFGTINWEALGKSLNDFFAGFDLVGLVSAVTIAFGKAIKGLTTMFLNIDWSAVAKKLGDAIASLFSDFGYILSQIPWHEIGEKVREAIENVPWGEIWENIVEAAKEAFNGLNEFLEGLTGVPSEGWEALEKAIVGIGVALVTYKLYSTFVLIKAELVKIGSVLTSAGFLTFATILAGIAGVLGGITLIVKGIKEMIESPTWKAFWDILAGIALVVAGIALLLGGWVVAIVAAVVALLAMIASYLAEHWEEVKAWFGQVWDGIVDFFAGVGKAISDWWNGLMTDIGTFFGNIWNGITTFFGNIKKGISDFFSSIGKAISNWWSDVTTEIKNKWNNFTNSIKKAFDNVKNTLKTFLQNLMDNVKEKVNNIKSFLSGIADWVYKTVIKPVVDKFDNMKKSISDIFNNIKTTITNVWNSIWSGMKGIINNILGGVQTFINGIVKGINGLSSGLRTIGNKIFDIIGVDVKFNPISEVSIPKLETGTNEIETEGIYHLHPGEAVIPKQYNPALGGGTNQDTNERLDRLISLINDIEFTNIVNLGNEQLYKKQQSFNKFQQNKYGTTDLY